MTEYKKNSFDVSCNCGCSKVEISQWFEDEEPQEVYFSHYINSYNKNYLHVWNNISEKLKIIWYIITGKNYCVFELSITKKDEIIKFKKAVAEINENVSGE